MRRAFVVAALVLLLAAMPVSAQRDLLPSEVDGRSLTVTVLSGPELLDQLGSAGETDVDRIARIETLLAVTGRTIDDVSTAMAVDTDEGGGGYIVALRVAGADGAVLLALLLSGVRGDLAEPSQVATSLGGKDVIRIEDAVAPDEAPIHLYGRGDTVWLIGGSEDEVAALIETLP